MDVVHPKCAGLDVHQQPVVACARVVNGASVHHEVRTFGTTTQDLLALSDWLTAHGCTHVAMESSGVYWKPVWHVLGGHFELDRKSTRLNSSHGYISYAVFCLKKKNIQRQENLIASSA